MLLTEKCTPIIPYIYIYIYHIDSVCVLCGVGHSLVAGRIGDCNDACPGLQREPNNPFVFSNDNHLLSYFLHVVVTASSIIRHHPDHIVVTCSIYRPVHKQTHTHSLK